MTSIKLALQKGYKHLGKDQIKHWPATILRSDPNFL